MYSDKNICSSCARGFQTPRGLSIHISTCVFNVSGPSDQPPASNSLPVPDIQPAEFRVDTPERDPTPNPPEPVDPDLTCTADPTRTVRFEDVYGPASAGKTYGTANIYSKHKHADWNPWNPFQNAKDYELANWFADSNVTKTAVQDYLERGLDGDTCRSFQSADELWALLERCEHGVGPESWTVEDIEEGKLFKRDILTCIQLLLSHLPFCKDIDYAPVKLHDSNGERIYNEINTGDWWWEIQERIPGGGTVLPVLFASDKTHLTNFSGDKAAWPLYMSIGNIRKDIRREVSKKAWVLVALLPVPPKNPGKGEVHNTWHCAVQRVLGPLRTLDISGHGFLMHCSDGQRRNCYPILAAWIADYQEHVILARIKSGSCPMCELPPEELGHELKSGESRIVSGDTRNVDEYREFAQSTDGLDELCKRFAEPVENNFWDYPLCNPYRLWQPDWLHQFMLGLFKHLISWVLAFLKKEGLLSRFNHRFKKMPNYPGFSPFKRAYGDVSQWKGKEMRTMLRFLVVCLAPLLISRTKRRQNADRVKVMKCTRAMCEFMIIASQRSLSEATLRWLHQRLVIFHQTKPVFREFRQMPTRMKRVNKALKEMIRRRSEAGRPMTTTQTKRARSRLISGIIGFSFIKMHLPVHIADCIRYMGSPDNFTTDISELLHVENVKAAYQASNRVDYEKQMLFWNDRKLSLAYMGQMLKFLASNGYYKAESSRVLKISHPDAQKQNTRNKRLKHRTIQQIEQTFHLPAMKHNICIPTTDIPYIPYPRSLSPPRLAGLTKGMKSISLAQAQLMFSIKDLASCFKDRMVEEWGADLFKSICGEDKDYPRRTHIKIYNSVAYSYQPFQNPLCVEKQLLRCTPTWRGADALRHSIWTRDSEDRTQDTLQGRKAAIPLLYFSYTPPTSALQEAGAAGRISTVILKKTKNGRSIYSRSPSAVELAMILGTRYCKASGLPDRYHGCVAVEENRQDRYVTPISSIEGAVHLVLEREEKEVSEQPKWKQVLTYRRIATN